jgi:hypothetical protein
VLDPSENVRCLLRQEKERARGGKKDGTVSVLSEEIAGVKELILSISQAYAALPTVSSTVLLGVLAVLYGPMRGLVLTVVLVKDSRTEQYSSTAARAIY